MMKEPKGLAALIIASKKPSEAPEKMLGETEEESDEGEVVEDNVALETASEEVMSALTQNDPKAFAEALKAFIELC